MVVFCAPRSLSRPAMLAFVLLLIATPIASADVIELLSGAKVDGKVTDIDKAAKKVTFERLLGGRPYSRVYPYSQIHAVTLGTKRYILNEKPVGSSTTGSSTSSKTTKRPRSGNRRTKADIESLIDQLGRTPPDWYESTPLDYPQTLDLSWPQKPPGQWNAQKNMGQYIWDVINPNPGRWRGGIRLMHHLLKHHENDSAKLNRVMGELGRMYHDFEEDYGRAAFWWRRAGLDGARQSPQSVKLARCYWKLGNKDMAVSMLNRLPAWSNTIKLWADMGETDKAIQLAEAFAGGGYPDMAYLYAGDACRVAGDSRKATSYYEKVLKVPATGRQAQRVQRNHSRARANIEGIRIFDSLDLRRVADGTYRDHSPAYAGELHVEVAVRGGRIESVKVTSHKEKQFYSAISDTPRQIVEKQGVKGIDAVSGATITSEAIINATARALSKGTVSGD
ncbi:MAG: FMN-binding protein [Planctomycetes bacterium]|nr:FMN-binding protein [Planctomycetota bacterium]